MLQGLTSIAMLAFAANSVLARLALAGADIDPLAYTGIRLGAGALVLAAIAWLRTGGGAAWIAGSWAGAGSLLLYALAFSVAYVMIGAGPGALILFASVQITMLGWAVGHGERPSALAWAGMAVAFAGLVYLVSPGLVSPGLVARGLVAPGLVAPPLAGAGLMAIAGAAWGAYSLIGRGSRSALADTAGNFVRCVPAGIVLIGGGVAVSRPNAGGVAYALASGALASGLGYIIWYSVLRQLSRTRAALVQLTVPAIAALGGVVLIGEPLTWRLVIASAGILGGVALSLIAAERRA